MGRTGSLGFQMKKYSIVRMGNEFVVQAGEKSILKIASRRRAVKLITDAAELLDHSRCRWSTTTHQSLVISGSYLAPPKFLDDQAPFPYAPRRDTSPTGG
jgi:hypothetical protein